MCTFQDLISKVDASTGCAQVFFFLPLHQLKARHLATHLSNEGIEQRGFVEANQEDLTDATGYQILQV